MRTGIRCVIWTGFLVGLLAATGCATQSGDRFREKPLEPYNYQGRFLVGVLPFSADAIAETQYRTSQTYSGSLIGRLQEHSRYRLIERERLAALLQEQTLQAFSGMVDASSAQEVGVMLGAEAICITEIDSVQYSENRTTAFIAWINSQQVHVQLSSRIVSVETGEILSAAKTSITRGRRQWVAFGFLRTGDMIDNQLLVDEAMEVAIQDLAYQLSAQAPVKQ